MPRQDEWINKTMTITLTYQESEYLRNLCLMPYTCARLSVFPSDTNLEEQVRQAAGLYERLCNVIEKERDRIRHESEPEAGR
jgi:hypothetical protein